MTMNPQNTPLTSSDSERGPERQVHEHKCWPPHWAAVNSGQKRVEIRRDDRGHRAGDILILREWIPFVVGPEPAEDQGDYTGRVCHRQITHVLHGGQFGLAEGYVALSLAEEQE